jgi:hypothetical protein
MTFFAGAGNGSSGFIGDLYMSSRTLRPALTETGLPGFVVTKVRSGRNIDRLGAGTGNPGFIWIAEEQRRRRGPHLRGR